MSEFNEALEPNIPSAPVIHGPNDTSMVEFKVAVIIPIGSIEEENICLTTGDERLEKDLRNVLEELKKTKDVLECQHEYNSKLRIKVEAVESKLDGLQWSLKDGKFFTVFFMRKK